MRSIESFSLEELYSEINKRLGNKSVSKEKNEFAKIKALSFDGWGTHKMKVIYGTDEEDTPYFSFYFMCGALCLDFYYECPIEPDQAEQLIPSGFAEAAENTYEFRRRFYKNKPEDEIKNGLGVLKKCGYTNFERKDY